MNIYHHHTIHLCRACPCPSCHAHRSDAATPETNTPRSRPSFLGALADLARFAAMLSLVHVTGDRTGKHPGGTEEESKPSLAGSAVTPSAGDDRNESRSATVTELPSGNAILALFSQVAREHDGTNTADSTGTSMDTEPPLSPLAAALIAAFRDGPALA